MKIGMKKIILFTIPFLSLFSARAQSDGSGHAIRAALGYTHDFPGVNGYTLAGEYLFPLVGQFEGGAGAKYADMSGHPRTPTVDEFTRAATLDFNLYWVPVRTDRQSLRIGIGYSFSFYQIRRAYPVSSQSDNKTEINWPSVQDKGRATGINAIAEYEYLLPGTPWSIGLRGALYKAYQRTYFIGPVLGFRW